jgi:hypothetical protein
MRNDQLEVETERLSAIKVLFRLIFGTPGDIRSFQLCQTNTGYHTVYLEDLPTAPSAQHFEIPGPQSH